MGASASEIAVVGAGSIGCYIGGWLGTQAHVRLVGRERVRDMLAEHGLELTDMQGQRLRRTPQEVDFVTSMDAVREARLVLVTVKSIDTAEVARELASRLHPQAVVVSFQNGLRNVELLRQQLPGHVVLAGMVPFNVFHRGLGRLHRASGGELMVEAHPVFDPWRARFAEAGLPVESRADMPAVQAAKLLLNLNNAINALSNLPLREELSIRAYRRCLALAQREALGVLRASGIRPARLTPLPPRWFPFLLQAPDALFTRLAQRVLAIDPLARSSTWEDLAAGRPTEVDYINGEVVRLAQARHLRAPVNARLVELVQAAGREGPRVWSGEALWQALCEARDGDRGPRP